MKNIKQCIVRIVEIAASSLRVEQRLESSKAYVASLDLRV